MMRNKRLYVLRHGNAVPYGYEQDETRELTELGSSELCAVAEAFLHKNITFDKVFVSPYVRAQQTANVFLKSLGTNVIFENSDLITPHGQPIKVANWVNDQPYESILLVTHQPFAQAFIDYLVDEPLSPSFAMATGTIVAIEGELFASACCQFKWCISPS